MAAELKKEIKDYDYKPGQKMDFLTTALLEVRDLVVKLDAAKAASEMVLSTSRELTAENPNGLD